MKKYKLKQWYPSLPPGLKTGMIVEFDGINSIRWEIRDEYQFTDYNYEFNGLELKCTQYWELIEEEEPLFITEDGVDIFLGHSYILIDKEFIKHKQTASNIVYTEYFKKFKHESNADEYIWKNKPVFSYEDFIRWGNVPYERVIKKLAMERSKGNE